VYWLENIDKYIEHYASPAIQQRGKTLANIGAIRSIEYDTENNTGTAQVSSGEIYNVSIEKGVSQDFRNITTKCDCDYEHGMCKHEVAALHGLKKKFQYNSAAIINIINQSNTIHNSSSELELEEEMLGKYHLEAQYPPRVRDANEMVVKYNTISENLISFNIGEKAYRRERENYDYETVKFLIAPDKTTTTCTCNKQVMEMCNHQMKALHHLIIELGLPDLIKNFPKTEELRQIAANEYGLSSPDEVEKFFLFLDNQSESIPIRLHIISGKSNKKSEKIVSSVQSVEDPSQINPALRSIFLDYEKIKSLYNNQFPDTVHPKMLNLLTKHMETLTTVPLYYMKEKFSFRRADMRNVDFSENTAKVLIKARANNAQYILEGYILFGEEEIPIKQLAGDINPLLLFHNNQFYVIDNLRASRLIQLLTERPILKYSLKSKESFGQQVSKLSKVAVMEFKGDDIPIEEKILTAERKSIDLSENNESLILQPFVHYEDDIKYRPVIDAQHISNDEQLTIIKRDAEGEADFIKALTEFDSEFATQAHLGFFYKQLDSVINTPWIFELYRFCKEHEIDITGYENLEKINYNPNEAKVNISLSSGIDWFEGDVDMRFGDLPVEMKALRDAVLNNDTTVQLSDGTQGLLPEEWIDRLSAIFRNSDVVDGKLLISKMKFNLIDSLFDEINDEQLKMEIDYRKRLLLDFDNIEEVPIPDAINAELRPYQKQGFYWLKFLDDFGFGGCLADDMGLGKTLQVITFLAYKKQEGAGTNLIVLPKSLLFNWEDEIRKFCPSLTYMIYHGNKRKTELKNFEKYDMILSTYGTVTNDIEDLMQHHFSYAVLDESQAIKNPTSKRYKAMRLIKSDNKIVMTGTPIENQTFDLYAQFNFINPGFFGSSTQFKMHFAEPIDLYGNQAS